MRTDSTSRTLLLLAGLALLGAAVWLVREVLPPFLIAIALALLLDPFHDRLQERGLPRGVAVALTFGTFLALFGLFVAFVVPLTVAQVADLVKNLDTYELRLRESVDGWVRANSELLRRLNLPPNSVELWTRYQGDLAGYFQLLLQRLFALLQDSAGKMSWLIVVPIVTLYLLIDLDRFRSRLVYLVPDERREQVLALSNKVGRVVAAYIRGLSAICASYGLVVYLTLEIGWHQPYAVIVGLAGAVLYAVPYLGQLGLILAAVIVAWATGGSTGTVFGVAVTLLGIGQLFDQLITPRVIGRQVGLHPVIGLFALMVGGQLFGLLGMVVAWKGRNATAPVRTECPGSGKRSNG